MKLFPSFYFSGRFYRHFLLVLSLVCCWTALNGKAVAQVIQTDPDPAHAPLEVYSLWAGLVYASNTAPTAEETGKEPRHDQIFTELVSRLKAAFKDYKNFDLLGLDHVPIFRAYESWAVLSQDKYFNLKFDSKGMDEFGGLKLHIQLWQDKRVLVKADAVLRRKHPLFIAGPKWRDGQLMFVVALTIGGHL